MRYKAQYIIIAEDYIMKNFLPLRQLFILFICLSYSSTLTVSKSIIQGTKDHVPEHLGAAAGAGGLTGIGLAVPFPLLEPIAAPAGSIIGGLIGNAFDDAWKDKKKEECEKKHPCLENPYLIRCPCDDL